MEEEPDCGAGEITSSAVKASDTNEVNGTSSKTVEANTVDLPEVTPQPDSEIVGEVPTSTGDSEPTDEPNFESERTANSETLADSVSDGKHQVEPSSVLDTELEDTGSSACDNVVGDDKEAEALEAAGQYEETDRQCDTSPELADSTDIVHKADSESASAEAEKCSVDSVDEGDGGDIQADSAGRAEAGSGGSDVTDLIKSIDDHMAADDGKAVEIDSSSVHVELSKSETKESMDVDQKSGMLDDDRAEASAVESRPTTTESTTSQPIVNYPVLNDDSPSTPLQDEGVPTPLQDERASTPLQDERESTPLQDERGSTPLLDEPASAGALVNVEPAVVLPSGEPQGESSSAAAEEQPMEVSQEPEPSAGKERTAMEDPETQKDESAPAVKTAENTDEPMDETPGEEVPTGSKSDDGETARSADETSGKSESVKENREKENSTSAVETTETSDKPQEGEDRTMAEKQQKDKESSSPDGEATVVSESPMEVSDTAPEKQQRGGEEGKTGDSTVNEKAVSDGSEKTAVVNESAKSDSDKQKQKVEEDCAKEGAKDEKVASAEQKVTKIKKEVEDKSTEELKGYATDTVNEFLGMLGMEKLDDGEKSKISVSSSLVASTTEKTSVVKPDVPAKTEESKIVSKTETPATPQKEPTPAPKPPAPTPKSQQTCIVCKKVGKCKYNIVRNGDIKHLCDDNCFKVFRSNPTSYLRNENKATSPASAPALNASLQTKKCTNCQKSLAGNPNSFTAPLSKNNELKDFCSQECLQKYEGKIKNTPSNSADDPVTLDDDDIEIVGVSKGRPRTRSSTGHVTCSVCGKMAAMKHEVNFDNKTHKLCSDPCFAAFRYANKLTMNTCENCGIYCYGPGMTPHYIQFEGQQKRFCSAKCVDTFKVSKSKVVPCAWCSTKKSNFDMIERVDANNKYQLFCSLNCLSLYRVNLQATSNQSVACDHCRKSAPAQYHLTMSDASVRNFCCYSCVIAFQSQFTNKGGQSTTNTNTAVTTQQAAQAKPVTTTPVTTATPARPQRAAAGQARQQIQQQAAQLLSNGTSSDVTSGGIPIISNVMSLAPNSSAPATPQTPAAANKPAGRGRGTPIQNVVTSPPQVKPPQVNKPQMVTTGTTTTIQKQIIVQPPLPKQVKNKSLLCKPFFQTKATSCRPHTQCKEVQTDGEQETKPVLVPVPIPVYVPVPMAMYTTPVPYPIPMPIPVPVPCFIPTTKKSSESILKHIKEIQERMPADPFEAELLMMAEAVANAEKSDDDSDKSDAEDAHVSADNPTPAANEEEPADEVSTTAGQDSASLPSVLGEDMLQMALRMATEMTEPVMDLEDSLQPTPINQDSELSTIDTSATDVLSEPMQTRRGRGHKRGARGRGGRAKRQRVEAPVEQEPVVTPSVPPPDANMVLKFTYGVNAWKHWVIQKNAQLEKASKSTSRLKLFKTDILQCTADELNYSLCLFVKEVRKPNGEEYNPDSIYYLCLGIQQYLFENGRIDNIFTDVYYEKFTECLNEVVMKYEVRINNAGLLVCRIEEEHLWESKQLGAHSPHVLLNTLVYFNTKYFMLRTCEDHLKLSFSHIMKHWKKTSMAGTKTQGRSVYLRYYAPAPISKDGQGKRKREESPVYEQSENVDNPLRCPVKLYEFYVSKCPESIKNRNDVFYLVPERSCVPDSPVWYSTNSLGADHMNKMMNRVRTVREIQESFVQTPLYNA